MRVAAARANGFTEGMDYAIRALYRTLLESWNSRDPDAYAALFAEHGSVVGYDGSSVDGGEAIRDHLSRVFADHRTASYVYKVREVRALGPSAALLRGVAGMVPPGDSDLYPAANAVQTVVASRAGTGAWRIELFQNTPAAFHESPEERDRLTAELRDCLNEE